MSYSNKFNPTAQPGSGVQTASAIKDIESKRR